MFEKEIINNLLINKVGSILYPGQNGEIEVPVSTKEESVTISITCGEIIICQIDCFDTRICVEDNKVVLPNVLLKQAKLNDKSLNIISNGEFISIRANNRNVNSVKGFVETLSEDQVKFLSDILIGNDSGVVVNEKIEPILFLLDHKNLIFRPIGLPFKFFGNYENNEFVLNNSKNVFFILPGINRLTNEIGYLFITELQFAKILYIFNTNGVTKSEYINRDLIFHYDPLADGLFKIFIGPEEDIRKEQEDLTKEICNDSEQFIKNIFRKEENDKSVFIRAITKNMLKVFNNKPKIS